MTVRLIFGLGWSLLTGLAGGWLVTAPWALAEQGAGDWTTVTKVELGTGLGLVALAILGLVAVAAQLVVALREAGVLRAPRPAPRGDRGSADSPEMEKALIALAQALAQDLDAQRGTAGSRPGGERAVPGWRQQP
jgi:hypothetical protein